MIEKVKIGPFEWQIIEKSEKEFKDYGEAALDKLTITIRENLLPDVRTVTILHELIHAAASSGGVALKQEELVADFLASQIYIFVKTNPDFVKKFLNII